jgi:trk system potassium uptake protein TrkA
MIELKVTLDMNLVGKNIRDIDRETQSTVLIGVIIRNGEVIVPNGDTRIETNDDIYVIGKPSSVYNFCKVYGRYPQKIKNVMILGGGRITYYLTNLLEDMCIRTKIIEIDKERCLQLSDMLPNTLVINGDGTDEEVLRSENINGMDGFVAVTGMDEENLMSSLIAKGIGVKKIITKISRTNYINIVKGLGLDSIISPKLITTNQILKYVRGKAVESLLRIIDGQAEIMEFVVSESNRLLNKPLKELGIPGNVIIATIVRNNEVVVPHGNDVMKKGDRIIVISTDRNISGLYDLMAAIGGGIQNELRNGIKKLGDIINM